VRSDYVVRIHNVIANDEALAFEMEYVDGPTLRAVADLLCSRGRSASLSDVQALLGDGAGPPNDRSLLQWCVRITATIARALAEVHRVGLIHRDVKPSNILLRRDGTPLLADFGLVRDLASSATRTDAFVGTLNYAAPEQLRADGEACDARSDVYSLAATLWELLVGAPPTSARSALDAVRQIEQRGAPRLRQRLPDAPRDLETILEKALEPDPAARYPSAEAFADDLDLLLRWRPIRARSPGPLRRLGRRLRPHRRTMFAAGAGAALIAGAIAIPAWMGHVREQRLRRSDALVRTAHATLVSEPIRDRAHREIVLGSPPEFERVRALNDSAETGPQAALRAYRAALTLTPERGDIAREALLVAIAAGSGTETPSAHPPALAALDLSPLSAIVQRYAAPWAEGRIEAGLQPVSLEGATVDDRQAIGLLAFLSGDVVNCEAAWSGLDPIATDAPLTDAGLGLLYAVDDRPERAYPRLLQAIRVFPDNGLLAVTLAEVCVALGDGELAVRWIQRAEELGALAADLAIARADLLRSTGQLDACRERLEALDPRDARVALRLARLDRETGRIDRASARLTALIADSPRLVRARIELGRGAIQRGDRATYLRQAEWIAARDFLTTRSPGTIRDAADLLHAGGLHGLARRMRADPRDLRPIGTWAEAAMRRTLFSAPERIEDLILRRVERARDLAQNLPLPSPDSPTGTVSRTIAAAVGLVTWYPELIEPCSAAQRLGLLAGAVTVRIGWRGLVDEILPALLGHPDSYRTAAMHSLHESGRGAGERFGAVEALGDVDGDGIGDYLCGSYREPVDGPGLLRLVSGRNGATIHEVRGIAVGFTIAALGDLDRDGIQDFAHVEGVELADGSFEAVVRLRSGASAELLRTLRDPDGSPTYGSSIVSLEDLDGDGRSDLAVASMGEVAGPGFVRFHSGADGRTLATAFGPPGASFGASMTAVPDLDGDGMRDLLVGGMGAEGARGRIWVLSSRSGAVLREQGGPADRMLFGAAVASGADLDGDGIEDYAIGSGGRGRLPAAVFVHSGHDGRTLAVLETGAPLERLVQALTTCDVDGDGVAEVIGGIGHSDTNGPRSGRIIVWSGRAIRDRGAAEILADIRGASTGSQFGTRVAAVADHLGPGFGAVLCTAPGSAEVGRPDGRVWMISPVLDPADARRRRR
jgi:tetratricopeptide (TPR) repeat protein